MKNRPKKCPTVVLLLLIGLLAGCGTFRQDSDLTQRIAVEDLRMHGRAGRACARVAYYAGLPLDLLCLPVTYPLGLLRPASTGRTSVVFYPGYALQSGVYLLGTGVSYPAYWLLEARPDRRLRGQQGESDDAVRLWRRWPYVAIEDYPLLLLDTGRSNAPPYTADRPFAGPLRFGRRPKIAAGVRENWENWTVESAPAIRRTGGKGNNTAVAPSNAQAAAILPATTPVASSGIAEWLKDLGDVRYAIRESAQSQLLSLAVTNAEAVLEATRPVLASAEDPEVQVRLLAILDRVFDVLVLHRPRGYLGISMQMTQQAGPDQKPVYAVQVMSVMRDSAAMAAGLQPGDRIVRLDEFEVNKDSTLPAFAKFIQSHRPGSTVTIVARRREETLKVEAKLGLIPEEMRQMVVGSDESRETQFREWLQEQCRPPAAGPKP